MKEREGPMTALQAHHVPILQKVLEDYGGDVWDAAYFYGLLMDTHGYTKTLMEGVTFERALQIALEALRTDRYSTLPDGEPDLICMACRKECTSKPPIPLAYRDDLRPIWELCANKIYSQTYIP